MYNFTVTPTPASSHSVSVTAVVADYVVHDHTLLVELTDGRTRTCNWLPDVEPRSLKWMRLDEVVIEVGNCNMVWGMTGFALADRRAAITDLYRREHLLKAEAERARQRAGWRL